MNHEIQAALYRVSEARLGSARPNPQNILGREDAEGAHFEPEEETGRKSEYLRVGADYQGSHVADNQHHQEGIHRLARPVSAFTDLKYFVDSSSHNRPL